MKRQQLAMTLLASVILAACGGGGSSENSGNNGASTSPTGIATAVATATATPTLAPNTTPTATPTPGTSAGSCTLFCDDFATATTETLLQTTYKSQPDNSSLPMYLAKSGTISVSSGAVVLDGARLQIGAQGTTDTSTSGTPGGSLDLSKAFRIEIDISAVSGTTSKAFQIFIDNNTTSSGSSPLGSNSKIYSKTLAEITAGSTITVEPATLGTSSSFIGLRTESGAVVSIDAIRINYTGSNSASPTPTGTSTSITATPTGTSTSSSSATAPTALPVTTVPVSTVSGGFATTGGGNISGARSFEAKSLDEMVAIIAKARYNDAGKKVSTGAYPVHITYTGNEDALIAQMIKDHTVGSDGSCPNPRWSEAYRSVEIKEFTAGITIEGANGSSANFGIPVIKSSNVIIRNMKIGALAGAKNDADMLRIDDSSNVWVDHNELFAVNNECKGSPDGDLTFESALDIKGDSHNITVSYNYIHDSKKVGLDGSSSSDIGGGREITLHHNYYYNVNGRLPLQRGGWTHIYNNFYDKITSSGINVRTGGISLIESNWFQNSLNPVTCRYDTVNCGKWELRHNNATSAADNSSYGISWDDPGTGGINAADWSSTTTFPSDKLTYSYSTCSAQYIQSNLLSVVGVGKNNATLNCAASGKKRR